MKRLFLKISVLLVLFFIVDNTVLWAQYICKPCNLKCDTISFKNPGICPHCNMDIIQGSQNISRNITFENGSGNFLITDSRDSLKRIRVFYHKPEGYSKYSKILMVIPGAGRNADDYRDSWVEISENHNVLILSPEFSNLYYEFKDYHLGGLVSKTNIFDHISKIENTNKVKLDESDLEFTINQNSQDWLFYQLDRIFKLSRNSLHSRQSKYDLFGHSAGGHVLHRLALFHHSENIDRILASNASFYTIPSYGSIYPFGLEKTPLTESDLRSSFKNKLVVFLGEEDNENETGGTFLVSESANEQGNHRFSRGKYFYNYSMKRAEEMNADFEWTLKVIPGVGHDFKGMAEAAGKYLYE